MYKIIEKRMVVPNIHSMKISAPAVAKKCLPGQFVIVMVDERGERIPLSIADWNREEGLITIVFMEVGSSTRKLAKLKEGDELFALAGPLGSPSEISRWGTVLCIGGCYGIGTIYPISRALKEEGNKVITLLEARSSFLLYWQDKLKLVSDELLLLTRDGTVGLKGHVTTAIKEIIEREKIDRVMVNGCTFLLMVASETTRPFGIKTVVSLNPIMIDGTGMCGVCRVSIAGKTKFACVDGPDFDGHEVDWETLLMRRSAYLKEELESLRFLQCEEIF
ncbi:MAG: sulfide/dihydroorotate dehydrogenase-like FAD/NAD-binding protein [Candidatus Aminicenantes bacterium]|nr:sulfide/dihydroorotate dehydrogenase-like FAD/NAD-binding protein [Candidatus Aminicenantes bacterium]